MKILTMTASNPAGSAAPGTPAERLIDAKHSEYGRKATRYCVLYYVVRLSAGLSAALLPFVVSQSPILATNLSIVVVIATVMDFVFNPKDKWKLFSRATDLIMLGRLRLSGEYEANKELLNVLAATENANLEQLVNLDDLLEKVKKNQPQPS
jgi:hypothetical protein